MAIDLREKLTQKLGPLPVWAWGAVVGGAILAYRVLHGGSTSSPALQTISGGTLPDGFTPGSSGDPVLPGDPGGVLPVPLPVPGIVPITPPAGGGVLTCDPKFLPRIHEIPGFHHVCQNGNWVSVPIPGYVKPPIPLPHPQPHPIGGGTISPRPIINPRPIGGVVTPPRPVRPPISVVPSPGRGIPTAKAKVLGLLGAPGAYRPAIAPTTKAPAATKVVAAVRAIAPKSKAGAKAPPPRPVTAKPAPLGVAGASIRPRAQ